MSIEAMKQALEALENMHLVEMTIEDLQSWNKANKFLRQAIAELESQEQGEPVARPAPVQDDHQSFIDSLPTDNDDKMFMQIDHWAHKSYKRHQSSVRGQAITAADAYESHIVWAALRWAKENRPPQRTKQEPDVVMHWHSHTWTIINPPPKNSSDVNLYYATPQRTWVGLTEQQRNDIENDFEVFISIHVFDAIEAKLKERNGYSI